MLRDEDSDKDIYSTGYWDVPVADGFCRMYYHSKLDEKNEWPWKLFKPGENE